MWCTRSDCGCVCQRTDVMVPGWEYTAREYSENSDQILRTVTDGIQVHSSKKKMWSTRSLYWLTVFYFPSSSLFYWQRCELLELYRTPRSGRMEQPVAPIKRSGAGRHVELAFHRSRNVQTPRPQCRSTFRGFNGRDHVVRTGMLKFDSRWTALFSFTIFIFIFF